MRLIDDTASSVPACALRVFSSRTMNAIDLSHEADAKSAANFIDTINLDLHPMV